MSTNISFVFTPSQSALEGQEDIEQFKAHMLQVAQAAYLATNSYPMAGDIIRHYDSEWEHILIVEREFMYQPGRGLSIIFTISQPD